MVCPMLLLPSVVALKYLTILTADIDTHNKCLVDSRSVRYDTAIEPCRSTSIHPVISTTKHNSGELCWFSSTSSAINAITRATTSHLTSIREIPETQSTSRPRTAVWVASDAQDPAVHIVPYVSDSDNTVVDNWNSPKR